MAKALDGKVAIVTGAGGGIGAAIARHFIEAGAAVIACDIDDGALVPLAEEHGQRIVALRCDVSAEDDARAATALAVGRFGKLTTLVNNAATFRADATVAEMPREDWDATLAVNLTGAYLMSKYAVPAMQVAGGGSIIHIASQFGSVGRAGRAVYCASKAGLIGLAKAMALDHAADGIRVNSLSPGPVLTERILKRYGGVEAAQAGIGRLTALNRHGRPDEIAEAALFLASDAASFVTGIDLLVDGGYTAQ